MLVTAAVLAIALLGLSALAAFGPGFALALTQSPQWTVTAITTPTNLAPEPGSTGFLTIEAKNTGGAPSDGSTITVADTPPSGLLPRAEGASGVEFTSGGEMSCVALSCTYTGVVAPDDSLVVTIPVEIAAGAPETVRNVASVSGGGASEATAEDPTTVSATPAAFGIAPGSTALALSTTEAGAHPDLTASLAFNSTNEQAALAGSPKEVVTDLPPGFVGDVADTPRCPAASFARQGSLFEPQACPLSTQVGTTSLTLNEGFHTLHPRVPVYNLTTNRGEITRLGFFAVVFGVEGTVSLRPGDYGVRTTFRDINETRAQLDGVSLSLWGVPAESSHDAMRGLLCGQAGDCTYFNSTEEVTGVSGLPSTSPPIPFLTSPTQCTGAPLRATFAVASWEDPAQSEKATASFGPLTGCDALTFGPAIAASPDTAAADTPAGFTFDVNIGQEGLTAPEGTAAADVKNTTVTLPVGVAINPGQASGLGACQPSGAAVGIEGAPSCPADSKIGQVELETPILKNKLDGDVYLLQSNPPDLKVLVAPEDPSDGIYVKFVGDVHLNETTGQLVTTFENTPQLPFSDLKLSFSGGAQAALATPTGCGIYATNADFTPWSGEEAALVNSSFAIESGTNGAACSPLPLPFAPQMNAGATTDQAGGFTDFSLLLSSADDQQRISTLQFKAPEGLLGMIGKVPLCGEPQASQGTCSAASQIGHTVIEAGPGPYPLVVPQPGQPPAPIYLTGGYKGAPYGLSIVVPLVVGPFTLQTQVVRAKIEVNPLTAQLMVTTDPLPSIIDGVPSDLRTIDAIIDRPEFMFNPTNCEPASFSGTATGTEGTAAPISTHFQVGSCQSLKFKPDFKVSTSGRTSKTDGASLDTKIVYPVVPVSDNQASTQANIKSVKVDLPKLLPSRLTTLQKACTAAVFDADPANCPAASVVGHATALTPVLPVPLTGPAYFVSHGDEAFPSLIVVLQGYGVTVDLVGTTFISKAGITSSTFKQVPDVPVTSFELTLPEGRYSALAANGNLCKHKLAMPTAFTGQNGAVIHQSTPITVTGCPRSKPKTKRHHKAK